MNLKNRLDRLIAKKKEINEWVLTSYILCKCFGWDYYILIKQPIPFVLDMMDAINYEASKEQDQIDGNTNKKGKQLKGFRK